MLEILDAVCVGVACSVCKKHPGPNQPAFRRCSTCCWIAYCPQCAPKIEQEQVHCQRNNKEVCNILVDFQNQYYCLPTTTCVMMTTQERYEEKLHAYIADVQDSALLTGGDDDKARTFIMADQYLQSPRVCNICSKNQVEHKNGEWFRCTDCHYGFCCSQEHFDTYMEKHHTAEVCMNFQKQTKFQYFKWDHYERFKEHFMYVPVKLLQHSWPTCPPSWESYFTQRINNYATFQVQLPPEHYPVATELLSQTTTTLLSIYKHRDILHKFLANGGAGATFTLHVVAPVGYTLFSCQIWEDLLHCIPAVKHFRVAFIGPTIPYLEGSPKMETGDMELCNECTRRGRTHQRAFYSCAYHDFAECLQPSEKMQHPDLIVMFNTCLGQISESESWTATLEHIINSGVPACFTSLSEKGAVADASVIKSLGPETCASEFNPFCGVIPMREKWPSTTPHHGPYFYYTNMYTTCFRGRRAMSGGTT